MIENSFNSLINIILKQLFNIMINNHLFNKFFVKFS